MLQLISQSHFSIIYDIMHASFPDDEYRPYEEQLAHFFKKPEYRVYSMPVTEQTGENKNLDVNNTVRPAGFLAVWEFAEFIFIEHFAVDPKLRNSGTGSGMLQELVKLSKKPVCLEVDASRHRIGTQTYWHFMSAMVLFLTIIRTCSRRFPRENLRCRFAS